MNTRHGQHSMRQPADVAMGKASTAGCAQHLSAAATVDSAGHSDCRRCGACCAAFRVSFYWAEADAFAIPDALVEQIGPWYACMAGSNASTATPRCHALAGEIGKAVVCTLYARRPSPCRELEPGDAQCARARKRHRLPALGDATGRLTDSPTKVPPSPA